jgi:hypothetical protein
VKYNYNDQVKKYEMDRACGTHGKEYECIKVLVGKPERKKSLGSRRHRWQDSIKMVLREIGWGGMGWIHLANDRD